MPISPRNSPAAVAHLLTTLRPTHILVSVDHPIRQLVQDSLEQLKDPEYLPKVCSMPEYEDVYIKDSTFSPLRPRSRDVYVPRIIVHSSGKLARNWPDFILFLSMLFIEHNLLLSSGSSSFPKPIPWSDRSYLQTAIVPRTSVLSSCVALLSRSSSLWCS